ncbi:MAG: response regulator [Desulfamplus sp.]|nr:response regulator [Desulfamplus sp.]
MNVLLIDDDIKILKLVSKLIQNCGHKVITAENGRDGLNIFLNETSTIDMIISDVMMPLMDGLELLAKIRQHNSDIPFIVTTGFTDTEMVIKALKQGATDFITKPYSSKELSVALNRIESMLNTKQSIDHSLPFINSTFQASMPSKTELIPGLLGLFQRVAKPYCRLYGINIADIITSLSEAISNAVVHGNLDIPSSIKQNSWEEFEEMLKKRESMPEYADKPIHVCFQVAEVEIENTQKRMIMQWDILDNGKGFDYNKLPNRLDPLKSLLSGRGVFLIRSFMDEVSWNSKGNGIKMVKYLKK